MLSLLTLNEAALFILHWQKQIDDPLAQDALTKAMESPLKDKFFLSIRFLRNAIDAGVLPALKRPMNRSTEKMIHESIGVPEDVRLPRQYDFWVTFSDLVAFVEQPDHVPNGEGYPHSRDALGRVAWILLRQAEPTMDPTTLFTLLAQLSSDAQEDGFVLKLGDTTLKTCIREILATGELIERNR